MADDEALKLQEGQDAALQTAAENSKFAQMTPSVVFLQNLGYSFFKTDIRSD